MKVTNIEVLQTYLKKSGVLSASDGFLDTLEKLKEKGLETAPRGQKVRELVLETIPISPQFPLPDFKSRPFNWKYFAGELAWYLSGIRNIEYIKNFSSFWDKIADDKGNINSNYGNLLFYSNQLIWAYESLVKDKESRQAISFVNRPEFQYEGNKDFVCTFYLNFWIRQDELHMKVQMRSNDLFYGYSYDVPFFAVLMQTMWHNLREHYPDLKLGKYYHCADNIHYYERHFELADKLLAERNKNDQPYFVYSKTPMFKIKQDGLEYSKETLQFIEEMNTIIQSGEITHDKCKNALSHIFLIQ
jgi:thymidylate synthase